MVTTGPKPWTISCGSRVYQLFAPHFPFVETSSRREGFASLQPSLLSTTRRREGLSNPGGSLGRDLPKLQRRAPLVIPQTSGQQAGAGSVRRTGPPPGRSNDVGDRAGVPERRARRGWGAGGFQDRSPLRPKRSGDSETLEELIIRAQRS